MEILVKRIQSMGCKMEREEVRIYRQFNPPVNSFQGEMKHPADQTIKDLIAQAVNPLKLAQMDIAFLPQL